MTYGDYPDLKGVKKVLVIKLRHLGDVLLTAPVFSALKQRLPEAEIDAYIYKEAFPMLEGHPAIQHFFCYDRREKEKPFFQRFKKEWALLREIRKKGYDCVLNLTEGERGYFAARASLAPFRIGFEPKKRWQRKFYTHRVKHCPTPRHTVERNLDALRRIGIFPGPNERGLFFHVPKEARCKVQEKVGLGEYVLIHPTSRWRFKCWSMQNMRRLAEWLLERGKKVVVTSGPDPIEQEMVEEMTLGLPLINLAGKISLKEFGALIEGCAFLVCVDSVPLHMASALQKPVLALFGPTSDVTWGPWQHPAARVVVQPFPCRPCYLDGCGGSKYSDCLQTLSVEQVKKEMLLLEQVLLRNPLQLKIFSKVGTAGIGMGEKFVDSP